MKASQSYKDALVALMELSDQPFETLGELLHDVTLLQHNEMPLERPEATPEQRVQRRRSYELLTKMLRALRRFHQQTEAEHDRDV